MSQLNTIVPTVIKEWKMQSFATGSIFMWLGNATRAAVLAWIVYQSHAFGTLGYVAIGTALLAMWTGVLTMGGWTLEGELYGRTLDFMMISRTRMPVILFSKNIGQVLYQIPTGLVSFFTAIAVGRMWPDFSNMPTLVLSLLLVLLSMVVIGFFFSALVVLVSGRAGFFLGLVPFIAVIMGFILPVNQLPLWLEIPARITPSAWGMDTVWAAINGIDSWNTVARDWGICLLLIAVWLGIIYYLCSIVEKRIRITGNLGDY
jgi:ABC-type multidrug transport system permease subunit